LILVGSPDESVSTSFAVRAALYSMLTNDRRRGMDFLLLKAWDSLFDVFEHGHDWFGDTWSSRLRSTKWAVIVAEVKPKQPIPTTITTPPMTRPGKVSGPWPKPTVVMVANAHQIASPKS
jgi:hypothetical protein